jgi:hypothetical protein
MNQKYPSFEQMESTRRQDMTPPEEGIKINGLEQVVQMLRHADPAFRQSMLKRIHARNPQLAQQILRVLR